MFMQGSKRQNQHYRIWNQMLTKILSCPKRNKWNGCWMMHKMGDQVNLVLICTYKQESQ